MVTEGSLCLQNSATIRNHFVVLYVLNHRPFINKLKRCVKSLSIYTKISMVTEGSLRLQNSATIRNHFVILNVLNHCPFIQKLKRCVKSLSLFTRIKP